MLIKNGVEVKGLSVVAKTGKAVEKMAELRKCFGDNLVLEILSSLGGFSNIPAVKDLELTKIFEQNSKMISKSHKNNWVFVKKNTGILEYKKIN